MAVPHLLVVGTAPVRRSAVCGHPRRPAYLLQFLLLLGVPPLPALPLGALLRQVGAVIAAVADRAVRRRVEVDQVGADGVEERPVVAGDHHGSGQAADLLLQEGGGAVVEVVGRLVQQQRRRTPYEQRGQGQPTALSAGERTERAVVPERAEAQTVQDQGGAAVGVPGLSVLGLFEAPAVGVEEFLVAGVVFRDAGELRAEPIELGEVLAGFAQRLVEHRVDGGVGGVRHLLVEVAEVGRAGDASRVGFVDTGEYAQEGGLSDAVLPDQADAVAGEAVRETPSRTRRPPRLRTRSWARRAGWGMGNRPT